MAAHSTLRHASVACAYIIQMPFAGKLGGLEHHETNGGRIERTSFFDKATGAFLKNAKLFSGDNCFPELWKTRKTKTDSV